MPNDRYPYPAAVSRVSEGENSREPQIQRALSWLFDQPGGEIIVLTPSKDVEGPSLHKVLTLPGVRHQTWRGFRAGMLKGRRLLSVWPDREHLTMLWDQSPDAAAVLEWNVQDTAEWISHALPLQLLADRHFMTVQGPDPALALLPDDVRNILKYVSRMAAGYSSGLKWDEVDRLKADMMNRPKRWVPVEVDAVRAECLGLGMRPDDVDTIVDLVQRRKDGRRFRVSSSHRTFAFG